MLSLWGNTNNIKDGERRHNMNFSIQLVCQVCRRVAYFCMNEEASQELPDVFLVGCRDCKNVAQVEKPSEGHHSMMVVIDDAP